MPPTNPLAFVAAKLGFKIGSNADAQDLYSDPDRWQWAFPLTFLDCPFKAYDHEKLLHAAEIHRPKYVVVRDIMTPEQCQEMGIDYYDFDTVIQFAESMEQFTDNVIVVPKYNCVSDIPERYIIGKPMSRYGKFTLEMRHLVSRRVHLLGGSWKKQRKLILAHKDQIVSFDNNNLWKISVYGSFDFDDGTQATLNDIGIKNVTSPMYASVVLSLCHIAAGIHTVYGTAGYKQQEEVQIPLLQSQMFVPNDTIVIVPCGSRKLDHPAKAREMYTGNYHKAALNYALSIALPENILILSAKYGLLALHDWIEPYELRMGRNGSVSETELICQMDERRIRYKTIVALGGKDYVNKIKKASQGHVIAPLKGKMAQQIKWMKQNKGRIPDGV
jgi:hypothetical protein